VAKNQSAERTGFYHRLQWRD